MKYNRKLLSTSIILVLFLINNINTQDETNNIDKNKEEIQYKYKENFDSALILTCSGWRLNHLPQVKIFLRDEINYFPTDVVYVGGDPRLVLYNEAGDLLKEISLVPLKQNEIRDLLNNLGLYDYRNQDFSRRVVTQ